MQDHVETSTSDQDPSIHGVTEVKVATDVTISSSCVAREFPGTAEQHTHINALANAGKNCTYYDLALQVYYLSYF